MTNSDPESLSRWSRLGLGGLASLCCLGPTVAAVTGGTVAVGAVQESAAAGAVELLVTLGTLAVIGWVVRGRGDCESCAE
jgi:hypothetical protein